jgi:hypothetical protein
MIVSTNWLADYVQLPADTAALVERLLMSGLNHESTTPVGADTAVEIEVTSNRPDCLGHIGVAREAAERLTAALSAAGIPHAIAGGVACNAYGHQRATQDVDVLVNSETLNDVVRALGGGGWTARYAGAKRSWRDAAARVDVDLLLSGEFPPAMTTSSMPLSLSVTTSPSSSTHPPPLPPQAGLPLHPPPPLPTAVGATAAS